MPLTSEYKAKKLVPFKKKSYRPWNIENIEEISTKIPVNQSEEDEGESINILTNSNREQTGNKQGTNREQTGNKQGTNREQIGNKQGTNREQIGNKQGTNREQNFDTNNLSLTSINRLCGLQQKILFYIVNQCLIRGQLNTGSISKKSLCDIENSDADTIKTSLYRLVKKGWIFREKGKPGKGGFISFGINESTQNKVLEELKNIAIREQIGNKQGTSPYSSSSIYKTTTNAEFSFELLEEWKKIDIEPLKDIKFTQAHLEQIFKFEKFEPQMVQDSINAFAFDIKYNGKSQNLKLSPLNVFMGIMKKGNIYLPPDNYESKEEIALKKYIEIKKQQEAKRAKQEEEAYLLSFKEWIKETNPNDLDQLVESKYRNNREDKIYQSIVEHYFKEKLWPKLKLKILSNI